MSRHWRYICRRPLICCPRGRGGEGIDFNANLNISTIDFGTAHVSPAVVAQRSHHLTIPLITALPRKPSSSRERAAPSDSQQISWGQTSDPTGWGSQWIADHATSQKAANKPVILEEFGVTDSQAATYTAWYNSVISSGLTGDLIWSVLGLSGDLGS